MFKNILKNTVLFSIRVKKLVKAREELLAKMEATRGMNLTLGEAETMRKKFGHQLRRVESVLYRAGKLETLKFETALA
uniref:Uncharacterized protein n=1 Tax=Burkholderia phage vB_BgluM-SURPRISE13 TaxID=3159457 RepID=A0AAU7PFY8_9VIRU